MFLSLIVCVESEGFCSCATKQGQQCQGSETGFSADAVGVGVLEERQSEGCNGGGQKGKESNRWRSGAMECVDLRGRPHSVSVFSSSPLFTPSLS